MSSHHSRLFTAALLGWMYFVLASEVSVDVTGEVTIESEEVNQPAAELVDINQPDYEEVAQNAGTVADERLVRILYSSSLEKRYDAAVNFIEERFPELRGRFTGGLYPQAPVPEFLVRVLQLIQLLGIVWILVGGKKLLRMLPMYKAGRPLPGFYWTIQDNPVPIVIFLYLIAPPMLNKMKASSAAFEVYLDDVLIYSVRRVGKLSADEFMKAFSDAGFTFVEPPK